jgi:hypothetical protein
LIVGSGVLLVHGQRCLFRERLGDFVFCREKKRNMLVLTAELMVPQQDTGGKTYSDAW